MSDNYYLIYLFFFTAWFFYTFIESISFDLKLIGHIENQYPLGVSYSNIMLSICRLITLFTLIPVALILDQNANKSVTDVELYFALSIPIGAVVAQLIYLIFIKKIRQFLANKFNRLKQKKNTKIIDNLLSNKGDIESKISLLSIRKLKISLFFRALIFIMFLLAYIGIPLCIFIATSNPDFRATIMQATALFAGVYSIINTIIVDPILSKNFDKKSFPSLFELILKTRTIVIFLVLPLLILLASVYA